MDTKVLYVLVSKDSDIFLEQTILSITSLRRTNNDVTVSVLMDDVTRKSLVGVRSKLLELIDEPIVVSLDQKYSNKEKSRILKTSMRNLVEGDFLFIDSDTIILGDLSCIDEFPYPMGAVYERNRTRAEDMGKASYDEALHRLNCYLDNADEYYNSGVMYVKDIPENHVFYKEWNSKWQESVTKNIYFDQPSLGCVNKLHNNYIKPLDGLWNCQGRYGVRYYRDAKIFHYLYDKFFEFPLMSKHSFDVLKETASVNDELEEIIANPFRFLGMRNELICGDDVKRFHSRYYSFIRAFDVKLPSVYRFFDNIINRCYSLFLHFKTRKLAPPR